MAKINGVNKYGSFTDLILLHSFKAKARPEPRFLNRCYRVRATIPSVNPATAAAPPAIAPAVSQLS